MLSAETKRKIDYLRDVLVGKIPVPSKQIEQITLGLIYKFMSDIDEQNEELGGKSFFSGEYKKYSWKNIIDRSLAGHERVLFYSEGLEKMSRNKELPQLFRDIFKGAFLPFKDPAVLNLFLKGINEFKYEHSEELGNAFEYLLSTAASQGDAGQFRTPRHIIDFIIEVVDPQKEDKILDPACGTAGFLVSAYKHILKNNTDKKSGRLGSLLTATERKKLTKNIVGYDIAPEMVRLSLVNLYLHGFAEPNIYEYDTLGSLDHWDDNFDCLLANPPFMTPRGGIMPHNRFPIQAKRSEVLFVDYITEHLTPNGKAGIIVPEGIIFQSGSAYKQLRKMLVEDGLWAVISLPSGVFNPYAGVKTSILFFNNTIARQTKEILFVKVENDGYDLGAQRRLINKNDLPIRLELLKRYKKTVQENKRFSLSKDEQMFASVVKKEKIAENGDYNLSANRYLVAVDYTNAKWSMVELGVLEKEEKIEFLRGQGLLKNDLTDDGKNKCIHYGEIYTLYDSVIEYVVSRTNFKGKITSQRGDVLVPATTTADAMGIAVARSLNEKGVVIGGDINVIRTGNKFILSDYLALLISNPPLKNELAMFAKGANILHLSNSDLKKLKIPLPSIEVQEEIVVELYGYQKIIDGAKQIIDNYKPTIKIDPKWDFMRLSELADLQNGFAFKSQDYIENSNVLNFRMSNIKPDASVDIDYNPRYLPNSYYEKYKDFALYDGDIVIAMTDMAGDPKILGVPTIVNTKGKKLLLNQRVGKFKNIKTDKLFIPFLKYALQRDGVKEYYKTLGGGGLQINIGKEDILSIKIPLPTLIIQKEIVVEIEKEQKIIEANKELIKLFEQKIKDKISEVWGN